MCEGGVRQQGWCAAIAVGFELALRCDSQGPRSISVWYVASPTSWEADRSRTLGTPPQFMTSLTFSIYCNPPVLLFRENDRPSGGSSINQQFPLKTCGSMNCGSPCVRPDMVIHEHMTSGFDRS